MSMVAELPRSAQRGKLPLDRVVGAAPLPVRTPIEGWEPGAILLLVLLMFSFGLVELYSASTVLATSQGFPPHHYALRQLLGAFPGIVITLAVARMDYRKLEAIAWPFMLIIFLLLVVTVLPGTESIAPRVNGGRRWIRLGFSFQPSEVAKLAVIVWTAALAVKKRDRFHSLTRGLLPFLVIWLVLLIPVMLQPNFSAVLLIALLAALVLFAAGARIGHFILLGMVAVPVLWHQIQGAGYRVRRLVAFFDPSADPTGITYQIHQSLIAVGSGGMNGVGFGESRQKFGFLPELHNDFLFAMIAEEWGFAGVSFTVAIFAAFALVGYRIARGAPDLFGYLLAIGMTNLIVVSALLHMGVALSLLPTTGVLLPFMSYGRTGLLVCFAAVGVLLSLARAGTMPQVRS